MLLGGEAWDRDEDVRLDPDRAPGIHRVGDIFQTPARIEIEVRRGGLGCFEGDVEYRARPQLCYVLARTGGVRYDDAEREDQ